MPVSTVATLNLDHLFTAVAGTTYSYQLLGETMTSTIDVDHVVNLTVPRSKLNKVLCYGSEWYLQTGSTGVGETGAAGTTYYQPEPAVALLLQTVLGSYLDDLTAGLTGVTSGTTHGSNASNYITDDLSVQVPNLVRKFQDIKGFTYLNNGLDGDAGSTGNVVDYLAQIPVEAIHSVNFSPVDTLPLSQVTGDLLSTHTAGQTMAHTGLSGALESLFEQAVGAGMVTTGNTGGTDLSNPAYWTSFPTAIGDLETSIKAGGSSVPVYGATFAPGQSLGIFVKYNLTKVRQYQLHALADLGATGASQVATLTFGGETFDAILGNAAEVSEVVPVIYQIIFTASSL